MLQSCSETRSVKWHQAHTTWFFETFVLRPFLPGYEVFEEGLHRLLSGYPSPFGDMEEATAPHISSRPSLQEINAFRDYVDEEMERLFTGTLKMEVINRIVRGLHHEQHHQELVLTDIKHAFFSNPLRPTFRPSVGCDDAAPRQHELRWIDFKGGLVEIGHPDEANQPTTAWMSNESPRHKVYLEPFRMANREVTCREYLEFIADDAYSRRDLWIPECWESIRDNWQAPLYWERSLLDKTGWRVFTLSGWQELSALLETPVCHVSFYEADAFARWRHCRLPSESEWEYAACRSHRDGNLLESGKLHPAQTCGGGLEQIYGDCWEWTSSSYSAYPGNRTTLDLPDRSNTSVLPNRMVLRGGSCATPSDHVRTTTRACLAPAARWRFTGIRLAH